VRTFLTSRLRSSTLLGLALRSRQKFLLLLNSNLGFRYLGNSDVVVCALISIMVFGVGVVVSRVVVM